MNTDTRPSSVPSVSNTTLRLFTAYSRFSLWWRFHSVKILKKGFPHDVGGRPVVFYLNHASWWDPMVCLLLSHRYFPDRVSFGPIDAEMLERYAFFKRLGFFGVSTGSARDTLSFLRTTSLILKSSEHALWITPQGRFMDVRERPLRLQGGLGAIAARNHNAAFVPIALEYSFWTEPRPEILVSFGKPVVPRDEALGDAESWTSRFSYELETVQDTLAASSCRRDPEEWDRISSGRSGTSVFYDSWRWARAKMNGEDFTSEHNVEVSQ